MKLGVDRRKEEVNKKVEMRKYITEEQMVRRDEDLICAICTDVVIQPFKCVECEHLYCNKCIKDSL